MSDPAIAVSHLQKSYGPDDLSFEVPRGVISGFLGPNGSGKTTTMRVLMGFAHSSAGSASLLGVPCGSTHEIFRKVAFVPELKDLYPMARAGEMIRLTQGFFPEFDVRMARALADEWEIPERQHCQKLSKGMKAKLWLLLTLCRKPELLILDEPTDGLDPIGIERTLQLLVQLVAENGTTVFFSSHQLPEVEQIAEHVVMIRKGRCAIEGEIDAIKNSYRRVRLMLDDESSPIPDDMNDWKKEGRMLTGFSDVDAGELARQFEGTGISLLDAERASLKDIFLARMNGQ